MITLKQIEAVRDFLLYGETIWKCFFLIQIGQIVSLEEKYSIGALMSLVVTANFFSKWWSSFPIDYIL